MMNRFFRAKPFLFFILLFASVLHFSFAAPPKEIEWSASRKLTWNDFSGIPNNKSHFSALSDCGILYKLDGKDDTIRIELRTYFYPTKSWVKQKDKSDYLLGHEQLHFDITELFTRKLRKELKSIKITAKNAKSKLTKAYKSNYAAYARYQHRYDKQSKHSINRKKQEQWAAKVRKELKELNAYASPVMRIKLSN